MISYRQKRYNIWAKGISYSEFFSRPNSLRQAIRSMDAPSFSEWQEVSNILVDEKWTEECQGVTWDGSHWIFSSNGSLWFGGSSPKALYVFEGGTPLKQENMLNYRDLADDIPDIEHVGQVCFHKGSIYLSHYTTNEHGRAGSQAVVFKMHYTQPRYHDIIPLTKVISPSTGKESFPEFQAINPWDGLLYSSNGGNEFFTHEPDGEWTGNTLTLDMWTWPWIQGTCFSPNGHMYIATYDPDNYILCGRTQYINYYSALNGHFLGMIYVEVPRGYPNEELQGICYADVTYPNASRAQIHAVVLENYGWDEKDDIKFKSFTASRSNLI